MSTITAAQAVKRIKDAIDLKANSSDVFTKTETTQEIHNIVDGIAGTATTAEIRAQDAQNKAEQALSELTSKANSSDVYTQTEVDDKINQFAAHYLTDKVDGRFVPFASHARLADAKAHHTKENPRFWYGDDGHEPDKNDYCVVLEDETHENKTTRYSFVGEWGNDEEGNPKGFFRYQYTVNDTALTDEQWDALDSGITAEKVQKYDSIEVPTKVSELENDSEYTEWKYHQGFVDYVNANAFIGVKQEGDELEFESDTARTLGNAYKVDLSKYAHADDVYSKTEVDTALETAGKVKTVNEVEPDENGNITIEIPDPDLSEYATKEDLDNALHEEKEGKTITLGHYRFVNEAGEVHDAPAGIDTPYLFSFNEGGRVYGFTGLQMLMYQSESGFELWGMIGTTGEENKYYSEWNQDSTRYVEIYSPDYVVSQEPAQKVEKYGKVKTVNGLEPDEDGNIEIQAGGGDAVAYKLVDGVLEGGAYNIQNCTITKIVIDSNSQVRINLPAKPNGDEVRDFILRIENMMSEDADVVFVTSEDEEVTYETSQDDWAVIQPGVNLISFTETKREEV